MIFRQVQTQNGEFIYLTPTQENTFHTCSKSHKDRRPHVLEFSGKGREGRARAKRTVTLGDGLTRSHAHRCTWAQSLRDRRSHAR